jgi:hypothetical protein
VNRNVLAAVFLVTVPLAGTATARVYGVVSVQSPSFSVDTVEFVIGGNLVPILTPDFGGRTGDIDTFAFADSFAFPEGVWVHYRASGTTYLTTISHLVAGQWFDLQPPGTRRNQVLFYEVGGVLDHPGAQDVPRMDVIPRVAAGVIRLRVSRAAGPVIFGVYDAVGNLVRTIAANDDGRAVWDGANAAGTHLPEGLYYIRVVTPSGTATAKVVLVR